MRALIYTKPSCPYCVKAKALLKEKNIPITESVVGADVSKADIQKIVDDMGVKTEIRTVPQIFLVNIATDSIEYIGGFTELDKYFKEQ